MAVENNALTWQTAAGEALTDGTKGTGEIYKAIALNDGQIAANGREAGGIITQLANTNQGAGIVIQGVSKYTAGGGTISANAELTVSASGYCTTAGSGDYIIGRNAQAAVTSGAVGTGLFNFNTPSYFEANSAFNALYNFVEFTTTTDLSSAQAGKAVDTDAGGIALTANNADGILVTDTASGLSALARVMGLATIASGADALVTKQQSITLDTSGYLVDADSGDMLLGRAITAINCLSTAVAGVNFSTPHYATSCLDVQY